MRVIIAGSRDITSYSELEQAIADSEFEITRVICGCARGADKLGEQYAIKNRIPIDMHPADWSTHGKSAGYIRNKLMAENADACIVLWDGISRGSKHMIDIALAKGLHTHIHYVKTPSSIMNPSIKGS